MSTKTRAARVLATWFGCGLSPFAPGTVGAAAAVILAVVLHEYAGWSPMHIGLLGIAITAPGIWAAGVECRACGVEDAGQVVIDEVAGQWITIAGAATLNWKCWLLAFALFRLFDIWKPSPVRQMESMPGGTGVMADDIVAGVYAALVLALAGWFNLY